MPVVCVGVCSVSVWVEFVQKRVSADSLGRCWFQSWCLLSCGSRSGINLRTITFWLHCSCNVIHTSFYSSESINSGNLSRYRFLSVSPNSNTVYDNLPPMSTMLKECPRQCLFTGCCLSKVTWRQIFGKGIFNQLIALDSYNTFLLNAFATELNVILADAKSP